MSVPAIMAPLLLAIGQWLFGLGLLSLLVPRTLRALMRLEKLCLALLLGMTVQAYVALLLSFTGMRISFWWWAVGCGIGLVLLVLRRRVLPELLRYTGRSWALSSHPCASLFLIVAMAALFAWTCIGALRLPTMDYDGLVIWYYRIRVLAAERTIYAPSLQNPLRLIAQPQHPYFVPFLQLPYAIVSIAPGFAPLHVPYMLFHAAYFGMGLSVARRTAGENRRLATASALLLMPAMATAYSMLSAREPLMAVMGFAAVYSLALWWQTEDRGLLWMALFFALAMQQSKVEGLPFLVGFSLGACYLGIRMGDSWSRRLDRVWPLLVLPVLALPWSIVRSGIPPMQGDRVISDYSAVFSFSASAAWSALRLVVVELFARPELYGLGPMIAVVAAIAAWRRGYRGRMLAFLAGPLVCLAATVAVYAMRQAQLPPSGNLSITRRVICFLPALVLACCHVPAREMQTAEDRTEMHPTSGTCPDHG